MTEFFSIFWQLNIVFSCSPGIARLQSCDVESSESDRIRLTCQLEDSNTKEKGLEFKPQIRYEKMVFRKRIFIRSCKLKNTALMRAFDVFTSFFNYETVHRKNNLICKEYLQQIYIAIFQKFLVLFSPFFTFQMSISFFTVGTLYPFNKNLPWLLLFEFPRGTRKEVQFLDPFHVALTLSRKRKDAF